MSASLENVHRGNSDLAEVTSLRAAVPAWQQLDSDHKAAAILTPEHALLIDGVATASFSGEAVTAFAERLQPDNAQGPEGRIAA